MRTPIQLFILTVILILPALAGAQVTITPEFATADEEITIRYDATQGTSNLQGVNQVIMHSGAIVDSETSTNWTYVIGDWGNPNAQGAMTEVADDIWEITITPRNYYAGAGLGPDVTVYRLGMVFREAGPCGGYDGFNTPCKEGKTDSNGDIFVDLSTGGLNLKFTTPLSNPYFANDTELVDVTAITSEISNLRLYVNDVLTEEVSSGTEINLMDFQGMEGETYVIKAVASTVELTEEKTLNLVFRGPTIPAARPAGIVDGINYDAADPTKVTLSLWAPFKSSVYVTGDFNNWQISSDYKLFQDGEHFWIELTGLEAGMEYAFQYLVDENIFVADPYADKILDRNDHFIPETSYPNLKEFPVEADRNAWYSSVASVFQTNQPEYQWQVTDFIPPAKDDLIIYELLIRDFFGQGQQNYQNLIDTLGYFERLGVNAIELMPIMEFNGNESWGYNPTFMFAPDKFYGTKNKLKEFIDAAHARGIAVILDIAMNHQDQPNPYVIMYFDEANGRPTAQNPWFNQQAQHPFNVFFDMDHESAYTQAYLDTVNRYWIREYKVDGFRFDLSKGFTQDFTTDVGQWSSYNAGRIALLKRMADRIREIDPDNLIILEHFGDNAEETELSNYGMMPWGNMHNSYKQNLLGYEENSDISWGYYGKRGWNEPNLVAYMESHDEERHMYDALQFGRTNNDYSVKNLNTALERSKASAAMFYAVPGPKMLWQFGEMGYDISINEGGRLGIKPTKWEYLDDNNRLSLWTYVSELMKLKTTYPIFRTSAVNITEGNALNKQIILRTDPLVENPLTADEMSVVVVANFDAVERTTPVNFPTNGTWYSYFNDTQLEVNSNPNSIILGPGEFRLYTNFQLAEPDIVLSDASSLPTGYRIYPQPASHHFTIAGLNVHKSMSYQITDLQGRRIKTGQLRKGDGATVDISDLSEGIYLLQVPGLDYNTKILIQR